MAPTEWCSFYKRLVPTPLAAAAQEWDLRDSIRPSESNSIPIKTAISETPLKIT